MQISKNGVYDYFWAQSINFLLISARFYNFIKNICK